MIGFLKNIFIVYAEYQYFKTINAAMVDRRDSQVFQIKVAAKPVSQNTHRQSIFYQADPSKKGSFLLLVDCLF